MGYAGKSACVCRCVSVGVCVRVHAKSHQGFKDEHLGIGFSDGIHRMDHDR